MEQLVQLAQYKDQLDFNNINQGFDKPLSYILPQKPPIQIYYYKQNINIFKTDINNLDFIKKLIDLSINAFQKEISKKLNKTQREEIINLIIKFQENKKINYYSEEDIDNIKEKIPQFIKLYLIKDEYDKLDKETQKSIIKSLNRGLILFG